MHLSHLLSRRTFTRMVAGTGAAAALGQLGRSAAIAASAGSYRAMVGIFLFGGNDGWNMVIPTDARHAAYAASRGTVAIGADKLSPLTGSPFALHPAMSALNPIWDQGALSLVLNTGTLFAPLDKATYKSRADLRPSNLMSHSDEQAHWQGLRARDTNVDGFIGRITDRAAATSTPSAISFAGSNLALIGQRSSPLILPSTGTLSRSGYSTSGSAANTAKNDAIAAFAAPGGAGAITEASAREMTASYALAGASNTIINGANASIDGAFVHTQTGKALTSDVARQLQRVAKMIAARGTLGHDRQTFFVSQGGYDTHAAQVNTDTSTGKHAGLLGDLAQAMAAFHRAMQALGLADNATAFTMSDFARTYRGNAQYGTDHAWGAPHLVVGGALNPQLAHGAYPDPTLGGASDVSTEGRFVPVVAQEEYIGAIARWHGVADADMPYIFPNWATWHTGGRGPLGLFRA